MSNSPEPTPLYPEVTVELTGTDGNVFTIIGTVSKALRRQVGRPAADAFQADAFESASYDEVLRTAVRYVDVV